MSKFRLPVSLLCLCFAFLHFPQAQAATFVVSNLNDSGPGSFRQAILDANGAFGPDIVTFSLPGTISVLSALPGISSPIIINGASAPGYVPCGAPVVAIDGGGGSANGMQIFAGASNSVIAALNVRNFQFNGIQLIGADNCRIVGCYIGTDITGNSAAGNGQNGIQVEVNANNNRFGGSSACERNIISGNGGFGVSLNGCVNDTVSGNYIGLNAAGSAARANGAGGMLIVGAGSAHIVGGTLAGEGNIISGNGTGLSGNGIHIDGNPSCKLQGNYFGLNAAGTAMIGNAENGISLNNSQDVLIGGTGATDGNVISGHNFHGMVLNGGSNNVIIQGNKCGTNAAGTIAMGNDDSGVIVINSSGVTIGGATPAHRNLLSASLSEYGIFLINADNALVQGNFIGTDVNGTAALPNFDGGIRILAGTAPATIGGSGAGEGNVIAFNTGSGIGGFGGTDRQVLISRNSMFCNTGNGIDLNGAGNDNHPAPVFIAGSPTGCNGTAGPNDVIELFYDSLCTVTCQGKDFIASVSANAAGNWAYVGALIPGATLVATARQVGPPATNAGNTSEFSCFVPLPVEGLRFSANAIGPNTVKLDWSTTMEVNNRRFDVERSIHGLEFEKIGEMAGNGDDPDGHSYTFTDDRAHGNRFFYRLRQLDFNGDFEYSEVLEVLLGHSAASIEVFPQPADDRITLLLPVQSGATIHGKILDLSGRLLLTPSFPVQMSRSFDLSTANLPSGSYIFQLEVDGQRIAKRIVIQH